MLLKHAQNGEGLEPRLEGRAKGFVTTTTGGGDTG